MILSKINRSFILFFRSSKLLGDNCNRIFSTSSASITDSLDENDSASDITRHAPDQSPNQTNKGIPVAIDEYKRLRSLKPCQPENPRLLRVSILGEPNVGKSTLTNKLVKWKVCSVSKKVHTTRKKIAAILVEDNTQIVFLDTPGFVTPLTTKKHHLEASFVMDPLRSVREADIIAVVVDISNKWINNRINEDILEVLKDFKEKKSILILNKVDAMKSKSRLLSLTRILTGGKVDDCKSPILEQDSSVKDCSRDGISQKVSREVEENLEDKSNSEISVDTNKNRGWTLFSKVFMVSALRNDGMDDLRGYLLNEALPREWMYHEATVTDQHPHEVALMILREKLLEYLPEEIPYLLDLRISSWETLSTGLPKIDMKIICNNSRHKRFVIGPGGRHIASCVEKCRKAMREAFKRDIFLHIAVE